MLELQPHSQKQPDSEPQSIDSFEGITWFAAADQEKAEAREIVFRDSLVESGRISSIAYCIERNGDIIVVYPGRESIGTKDKSYIYSCRKDVARNINMKEWVGNLREWGHNLVIQIEKEKGIDSFPITGIGYPELDSVIELIAEGTGLLQIEEMIKGEFYLLWDSLVNEGTVFQFQEVVEEGNKKRIVIGSYTTSGIQDGLLELRQTRSGLQVNRLESASIDELDFAQGIPKKCVLTHLNKQQVSDIIRLRPTAIDPLLELGRKETREEWCIYTSLQGLQYVRWGKDEEELGRYAKRYIAATPENYRKALVTIIDRFGEEEFIPIAKKVITEHYRGLDTTWLNTGHSLHSDIQPLTRTFMDLAKQVIRDAHPLSPNMTESGNRVNAKSLFGDLDFWKIVAEEYPRIFDTLVQYIQDMTSELYQGGDLKFGSLDSVGIIKEHFPKVYDFIKTLKPDFDPKNSVPFRSTN